MSNIRSFVMPVAPALLEQDAAPVAPRAATPMPRAQRGAFSEPRQNSPSVSSYESSQSTVTSARTLTSTASMPVSTPLSTAGASRQSSSSSNGSGSTSGGAPVDLGYSKEALLQVQSLSQPVVDMRANATKLKNYLVPHDPAQPIVRLSKTFDAGGFSKVRYGVDANGRKSIWRVVHYQPQQSPIPRRSVRTSDAEALQCELMATSIASPLLMPKASYLDSKSRFYTELEPFDGDLGKLALPLLQNKQLHLHPESGADERAADTFMTILRDIGGALDKLHQGHFLHRDIKPGNILFSRQHGLVLADFGLSGWLAPKAVPALRGKAGTPDFMSPETFGILGARPYSTAVSEVYSLGVTLADLMSLGDVAGLSMLAGDRHERLIGVDALERYIARGMPETDHTPDQSVAGLHRHMRWFGPVLADLILTQMLRKHPQERLTMDDLADIAKHAVPAGSVEETAALGNLRDAVALAREQGALVDPESHFAELARLPIAPTGTNR